MKRENYCSGRTFLVGTTLPCGGLAGDQPRSQVAAAPCPFFVADCLVRFALATSEPRVLPERAEGVNLLP